MKNLKNFAALVVMTICCVVLGSCSESFEADKAPEYKKDTVIIIKKDTIPSKPTPEPTDSTKTTTDWHWSTLFDSTLDFFTDTEMVEARNIGQVTRLFNDVPETRLDTALLSYKLGLEISAPTRVVTSKKELTVLSTASSNPNLKYGEFVVFGKDSIQSVSTDHSFPTQYYNISATTTSKRGYSLHAGHYEPYKYITEKAQWSKIWSEELIEVEVNDSIFNRETVHNEMNFVIRGREKSWTISRDKVVIVDHFVKVKEEEKKKEETAEFNTPNFTELLAYVRVHDVDKKQWNDAILLETTDAYYVVNIPFSYDKKDGKETYLGKKYITKYNKADIGKVSVKLNGVICVKGVFYPAYISEDASGWYGVWSNSIDQSVDMNEATASGLKNQPKNGNAKGSCFVEKVASKSTSGNILSVTGKTIGHTITTTFKIK